MTTYFGAIKKNPILLKTGNVLVEISRLLLGAVFVFSGFVKAIDPLGSTYKFDDYFRAFGGFFAHLTPISFSLAIFLSTLELVIGLNLILKVHFRKTSLTAFLFMLVMLPITLYIALKKDLVSDCGCFGDALVISNWATFSKNIVLFLLVVIIIVYSKKFRPFLMEKAQNISLSIFIFFALGLSFYCYLHLPLIDFLPYKVGVNIPEASIIPDGAPVDVYETNFIYAKNGQQKEFTLENYPKGDSTWKFVDQKSVLISAGYKAPIHDFSILTPDFEDITEDVLYDTGSTYLLIMYDLSKTSESGALASEKLYQKALAANIKFYALTASSDDDVLAFKQKLKVSYPFCKTDPTTLKTIIRANPGAILLKNGTIMGKWNWRNF